MRCDITVLGQGRDHGHEVRLACAVITDDQKPLVVHKLFKPKLRNDEVNQLLGHFLGDDIGLNKLPGGSGLIGIPQLYYRLDRFELNQLSIFHRVCPLAFSFQVFMNWPPDSLPRNLLWDIVYIRDDLLLRRPYSRRR